MNEETKSTELNPINDLKSESTGYKESLYFDSWAIMPKDSRNNADGIQQCLNDNNFQWRRINADYDELFNQVSSLHVKVSLLKEKADQQEKEIGMLKDMIANHTLDIRILADNMEDI